MFYETKMKQFMKLLSFFYEKLYNSSVDIRRNLKWQQKKQQYMM